MLLVLIIFGGVMIMLDLLIHYPPFQKYLIRQISETAQYDVETEKIRIGFRGGLGIHVTKLHARARTTGPEITADNVDISFEYRGLIYGQLIPERVFIKDARILVKPQEQTSSSDSILTTTDQTLGLNRIIGSLFGGFKWVKLENTTLVAEGSDYRVKQLNALIRETNTDHNRRKLHLDGLFEIADTASRFRLEGKISRSVDDGDRFFTQSTLTIFELPLAPLPWPSEVPFETGRATGQFDISGTIGTDMKVNGRFTADDLRFSVVKGDRTKKYHVQHTEISVTGHAGLNALKIDKLICRLPETTLSLTMQLNRLNPAAPKMDLDIHDIHSQPMPIGVFKRIFPTPLVPEWIEAQLFPIFSDGAARLDRFRLNGTIDQINQLNQPENRDALELRLTLSKLTALSKSPGLPVTHLGGKVAITGGQLLITEVNGRFGQSNMDRVTMSWPDLYGKSGAFHLGIRGDFRLADLKRQSKQPLLPGVIRREIDRISDARGRLTADIDLFFPTPGHPPLLKGTLTAKESQITHTALPFPLGLTTARIIFDENKPLQIDGSGRWGRSDFSIAGTLGLPWAIGVKNHPLAFNFDVNADMNLADLFVVRKWQTLSAEFRDMCAGIQTISGRVAADFNIHRTASKSSKVKTVGNFTTSHITLTHDTLKLPLDIQEGRLVSPRSGDAQFNISGRWGQSLFNADGHLASSGETVEINVSTFADPNEIIAKTFFEKPPQIVFNQSLRVQLKINKTATQWSFKGDVNLDDVKIQFPALTLSPPGTDNRLVFALGYAPSEGLTIDHLRFHKNKSRLAAKIAWPVDTEGKLSFDISATPLYLTDIGLKIVGRDTDKDRSVKGTLSGHLTGDLFPHRLSAIDLNGNLVVSNLILLETANAPRYNADLRFKGHDIDIAALSFPIGNSKATLQGHLTTGDHWKGKLNLTADTLDIPPLIRQFRYAQSPRVKDSVTGGDADTSIRKLLSTSDLCLAIKLRKTKWEGINLGSLQALIRYQNQRLRISKAAVTAPESLIKLSGTIADKPHSGISLLTYIKLEKKPLGALLKGLDIDTTRINGTISLEGGLFFGGKTMAEIIENLAGKVNVEITEGQINQSSVILKVLDFISIQNIFLQKPTDILKDKFYFKSIQGHINVQKGILTADRLLMKSPIFNAAVKGTLDVPRNDLQIALGVQPLNTIDFIISKIPILGHILAGSEKTILVYYFKVRGPLNDPTLKHVPFNNLGHALTGYFKRLFLTPIRIMTRISDTLEDIEKEIKPSAGRPVTRDPFINER